MQSSADCNYHSDRSDAVCFCLWLGRLNPDLLWASSHLPGWSKNDRKVANGGRRD